MTRWLATLRRCASVAIFAIVTAALVSAQLAVPGVAEWLARVQFMPAVITEAMTIFIAWLIITLIFGRVYCSTVCPLCVVMDASSRLTRVSRKKADKWHYRFTRNQRGMRLAMLGAVVVCLMGGTMLLPTIMDPYAIWLRFCRYCIAPLTGNSDAGLLTPVDAEILNIISVAAISAAVAAITVAAIMIVAAWRGRLVCNTLCPVGSTLGLISRYSILQIDIDTDRCTQCRRCVDVCKSECINITDHTVDGSRCVNCFDCLEVCRDNAIHYTSRRKQLSIPMMQSIKPLRRQPGATVAEITNEITQPKQNNPTDETIS